MPWIFCEKWQLYTTLYNYAIEAIIWLKLKILKIYPWIYTAGSGLKENFFCVAVPACHAPARTGPMRLSSAPRNSHLIHLRRLAFSVSQTSGSPKTSAFTLKGCASRFLLSPCYHYISLACAKPKEKMVKGYERFNDGWGLLVREGSKLTVYCILWMYICINGLKAHRL